MLRFAEWKIFSVEYVHRSALMESDEEMKKFFDTLPCIQVLKSISVFLKRWRDLLVKHIVILMCAIKIIKETGGLQKYINWQNAS